MWRAKKFYLPFGYILLFEIHLYHKGFRVGLPEKYLTYRESYA